MLENPREGYLATGTFLDRVCIQKSHSTVLSHALGENLAPAILD